MTAVIPRRSKAEAQEAGLVPLGHVWDEATQAAIPLAEAVRADSLARPADLAQNLAAIERNRKTLHQFIAERMQEAEYGPNKYPVAGSLHDFYRLPNYDKRALTKQGAEKLAQLFGLRKAATESVERICTKEFALAVVRVQLVDRWNNPAGSGEAACSTAETGLKRSAKKYDGDFRAAMNDVLARAGKRAFVQAVVYATATDEIFDASGEVTTRGEAAGATEEPTPERRFPVSPKLGEFSGKALRECAPAALAELKARIQKGAKSLAAWQPVLDAIDEELDARREEAETF